MYALVMVIHVLVCLVLIAVILLQAGRGGGISDTFGGGQTQSIFGTQTNTFMTRATEICAVVFIITSLSLGVMSTQRGKSLIEKEMQKRSFRVPAAPQAAATSTVPAQAKSVVAEEAKPAAVPQAAPAEGNAS